jgi:hypothetical protein
MLYRIYDAETGKLLEQIHDKQGLIPSPGESWPLQTGGKTVVAANLFWDAEKNEVFVAVLVREPAERRPLVS